MSDLRINYKNLKHIIALVEMALTEGDNVALNDNAELSPCVFLTGVDPWHRIKVDLEDNDLGPYALAQVTKRRKEIREAASSDNAE